jgi:gas vesicle protein
MSNSNAENNGAGLAPLLAGLGVGAVIALLLAPRSGKETRELLADSAREGKDVILETLEDLRDQVEMAAHRAKKRFEGAIEVGGEAYRREIKQKHSEI